MSKTDIKERQDRIAKLDRIRSLGIQPYAKGFEKAYDIHDLVKIGEENKDTFRDIDAIIEDPKSTYQTAGRLMLHRSFGKLFFAKLKDQFGSIQVAAAKANCRILDANGQALEELSSDTENVSAFKFLEKLIDRGDFIGVKGELFYTHKGELTLFIKEFQLLSKAVMPLPEKFHGLEDQETRYRQRYLDMLINDDVYETLLFRSRFIQTLREFYWSHGFHELDTPVLCSSASGAAAKPFKTHHNDFDQEFYLRICSETELKKATIGRFEKNFIFGTNFRNEGSDPSHMQEFMMLEHQNVYKTFEEDMDFTEKMFDHLFDTLELDRKIEVEDKEGNAKMVNFTTPWPRIDYVQGVNDASGLNIEQYGMDDAQKLRDDMRSKGIEIEGMDDMGTMTLIDYLYKKVLRPKITGPAFIYNYPRIIAPLARISDEDPNKCEKWQVVINGWEVINSYGELVDPVAQKASFEEQAKAEQDGDEEATSADDAFVQAMEYGMPCQAGFGMGIDRIIALISGQKNLRDVVLFPIVKEKEDTKKQETHLAVAIVNTGLDLLPWQQMNTIAHLNAAYGARAGRDIFYADSISTSDNREISLNTTHAIMIKQADSSDHIRSLITAAKEAGLGISEFTREMIETSDDRKVMEVTKTISYDEIDFFGTLIYGNKSEVEKITKSLELFS